MKSEMEIQALAHAHFLVPIFGNNKLTQQFIKDKYE